MAAMAAILKFFKRHLLQNRKSDWAKTLFEASERHRDSVLLKLFRSNLKDGLSSNSSNDISQGVSWIERKLDGKDWSDTEIQNWLNCSVWLSKMAAWAAILKILKLHLLPNPKSDWAQTWLKALGPHADLESLNHSVPISKMAAMSAVLKIFTQHLLPNCKLDWAEAWWAASEQHRDSELLKSFYSDIQDGPHGGRLENLQTMSAPEGKSDWAQPWLEAFRWRGDLELIN